MISIPMQSAIACRLSEKMGVNKEAFLCVIMFRVANLCQESLRRTLTFSLSSTFLKRVSVWLHLKSTFFSLAETTVGFFFSSSFLHFFNLRLFAQPYLETNSHLHLYRKMHCMEGNLYFLQIFLIQFWWVLQRQASSYCCDCCFVFLFVIRMRDDSGWCMWEAQLGGKDAITYS